MPAWNVVFEKAPIYSQMARNYARLKVVKDRGPYLVFYELPRPAVVLAKYQHVDDIDRAACESMGVDYTRRNSEGSAMYCDSRVIPYSIIASRNGRDATAIHEEHGSGIASALREAGLRNVTLGKHFSVRVDGKIIAGHGQHFEGPDSSISYIYEGVLAFDKWDVDSMDKVIKLRPQFGEKEHIAALPYVRKYSDIPKRDMIELLMENITHSSFEVIDTEHDIMGASKELEKHYKSGKWIEFSDANPAVLQKDQGFCFSLFIEEEPV